MADFYKNKIPIIRRDLNEGFVYNAVEPVSMGAVPRDYSVDPVEMRDAPTSMKLVDLARLDDLYDQGEINEDSLEHLLIRAIERGEFKHLDQNGFPDCWMHSPAHARMVDAVKQNIPVPFLNAVAAATMTGRTNGGWCGLGMKFGRDKGWPEVCTDAPYQSRRYKMTPALQATMDRNKALEDWYDLGAAEWDQKLNKHQFITCLFNNLPTPSDYNRYAHSMLSIRWVRTHLGWGPLTLNSWNGWGWNGLAVLLDHVPDGSCALRSSTPTA